VYAIDALPLDAGVMYTAVAHGYLDADNASSNNDNAFMVSALVDSKADLDSANFRVQALHAAAAAAFAKVDVWALDAKGEPATALIPDFDYGESGVVDLPAGEYRICLDIDADAVCDAKFSLPDLPAGLFVNLYAVNTTDGVPFLLAHLEDGTTAQIDAD
jgi:hypothetical protein